MNSISNGDNHSDKKRRLIFSLKQDGIEEKRRKEG